MFDISTRNGSAPIPNIMHNLYPMDGTTARAKQEKSYADALEQHQQSFGLETLPEIGTLYRDNTNGLVFEIVALAMEPQGDETDIVSYVRKFQSLSVIMRGFLHTATIVVSFQSFYSMLDPDRAYDFKGIGPYSEKKRFERTEVTAKVNEGVADQESQVKPWSLEKIEKRLASKKKRLYVVNTMLTKHGLPDILFEFSEAHERAKPEVCKLPASWVPVDILSLVPRKSLQNNARFLALLREGHVKVISKRNYRRIMETQAAQEELARVLTAYENLRAMHRPRPIKSEITNPYEAQ